MTLLAQLITESTLQTAFEWLCERRKQWSHNDDVWNIRRTWPLVRQQLQVALSSGTYRLSPLRRVPRGDPSATGDPDFLDLWSSMDALVLKALSIVLTQHLQPTLSRRCFHLAGHGGSKAAVREVREQLSGNEFVFRTDVKHYYASIRHEILFQQLQQRIHEPVILDLLWQYLQRSVCVDGIYHDITRGISLGCPLSPLMAAVFLDDLDRAMQDLDLFYVRFMDDWVILAPTRWKLRKAIRIVNQILERLGVQQHPDKTYIGRTEAGFDFLGYHMTHESLSVAAVTVRKFVARMARLYEQGASDARIGNYVRRWYGWVNSGLKDVADGMSMPPMSGNLTDFMTHCTTAATAG